MISERKIQEAARCVRSGGVIVYPAATVYGLGGDPERAEVVDRIRQIKCRPGGKPMLLLTDRWSRIEHWITNITPAHERMMAASPPRAITIVFDTTAPELAAVRGAAAGVAIRCTNDPTCRRIIGAAGGPLISTSANRAGDPPPHLFEDIDRDLLGEVDVALDAGRPLGGKPSTVVAVDGGTVRILRPGAVSEEEISSIIDTS